MKIIIATDAWHPQINGVVRTYENITKSLDSSGNDVKLINPTGFRTIPCPTYKSIELAVLPGSSIKKQVDAFEPDAIHVATEGPLGHATRSYCLKNDLPFTTSFHTQFPEYIRMRAPIPISFSYAYMRRFHAPAVRTFVPTLSQQKRLERRGFNNIVIWPRGVDTDVFYPRSKNYLNDMERPVFVYAGRVAVEKNIESFLELKLPGSKLVVGDGPDLEKLKKKYSGIHFAGFKFGDELASLIAASDVFVFPSLTDTFGIVMLEAMACGVPVAAFPVTGPIDVVENGVTGILSEDLEHAALEALKLDPKSCIKFSQKYTWGRCAEMFYHYLQPIRQDGSIENPRLQCS